MKRVYKGEEMKEEVRRGEDRREGGPLPWLLGRKWCLKGEVGRESLFLEPTLLLHREEQSFCMPVRASAGMGGEVGGGGQ